MSLLQLRDRNGARRLAVPNRDGSVLHVLRGEAKVRDLALEAARGGMPLDDLVAERLGP